jgi:hypothetical protein
VHLLELKRHARMRTGDAADASGATCAAGLAVPRLMAAALTAAAWNAAAARVVTADAIAATGATAAVRCSALGRTPIPAVVHAAIGVMRAGTSGFAAEQRQPKPKPTHHANANAHACLQRHQCVDDTHAYGIERNLSAN